MCLSVFYVFSLIVGAQYNSLIHSVFVVFSFRSLSLLIFSLVKSVLSVCILSNLTLSCLWMYM